MSRVSVALTELRTEWVGVFLWLNPLLKWGGKFDRANTIHWLTSKHPCRPFFSEMGIERT